MTRRRDACRSMNVDADVAILGEERFPCVEPHAYTNPAGAESLLSGGGGRGRVPRPRKREKECIALCVYLNSAVRRHRVSQQTPMLREHIRIRVAQLMQQTRR